MPTGSNEPVCDCWRLTRPLMGPKKLPSHICPLVPQAACANWAKEYIAMRGGPADQSVLIPFGEGRYIHFNHANDYPLSLVPQSRVASPARMVYMVLRQWVEAKDEKLTMEVDQLIAQDVKVFAQLRKLDREQFGLPNQKKEPVAPATLEEVEAFRTGDLSKWDLPLTPGTARYCMWKIHRQLDTDRPPIEATRGLLVTSILVESPVKRGTETQGDHLYQIAGSALWDCTDLLHRAIDIVDEHRTLLMRTSFAELKPFSGTKFNKGRPTNEDLKRDVQAVIRGEYSRTRAIENEVERREDRLGRSLNEVERHRAGESVRMSLSRELKKIPEQ